MPVKKTRKKRTVRKSSTATRKKSVVKKTAFTRPNNRYSIAARTKLGKPLHICKEHDYATDPTDSAESQAHGFELHKRRAHQDRVRVPKVKKAKTLADTVSAVVNGDESNLRIPGNPQFQKLRRALVAKAHNARKPIVADAFLSALNMLDATLSSGRKSKAAA